jgi:hypothetical protein
MNHSQELIKNMHGSPLGRKRVLHTKVEFYSVHIPLRVDAYRDVVPGCIAQDVAETIETLRALGFENIIEFNGPTGAKFVAVEANEHNRRIASG